MKIAASIFANSLLSKKGTFLEQVITKQYRQKDIEKIFTILKKAGIDGIELGIPNNFPLKDLTAVKKILAKNSVNVLSIHQHIRILSYSSFEEIEKVFQLAKTFNASRIVFHTDMLSQHLRDVDKIKELKKLEKSYKILACFENMQFHHVFFRKKMSWHEETFQNLMQKHALHITLDTSHLAQTKKDIISFFKKNKNLIQNIHISDYKQHPLSASLLGTYLFHLPFGKGNLPIKEFLQTLKSEKYTGNVTIEVIGTLEQKSESIQTIKKYVS